MLTTFLMPLTILSTWDVKTRVKEYMIAFLVLVIADLLAFPWLAQTPVGAAIGLLIFGFGTFAVVPPLQMRVMRAATELVRQRAPELLVEGPIQYDAAVEPSVAATKMPDSPVAGRATVLIFPDLNTGNNTYKAVQRSAGAIAIRPVLQGLNKPVNDLSRGALVEDIVNTVAITAIQAQGQS